MRFVIRCSAGLLALGGLLPLSASAFCGFYVAKADTKLFNKASQVALVRDGDRTVMTMANDYRGDLKEFAVVIPVPTVLQRDQIEVTENALLEHLDAYSAPRLVEYWDPDPCMVMRRMKTGAVPLAAAAAPAGAAERDKSLGVTVEAEYVVGEYNILILSAKESSGLETWLTENGYRIPKGASEVLGSYIGQNMKFFVAKVNLGEQAALGFNYLRPIRISYTSPKFMLPIRLGMVNADGPQDLIVYTLTRKGRVEATNYRTVKLPSNMDLPLFLKDPKSFAEFYKDMFARQVEKEEGRAIFTEYAWDMAWCDPCAADPLSREELTKLGCWWLAEETPQNAPPTFGGPGGPQPQNVFLTRLHVRYDWDHFPQDLVFQETGDRSNFQGRYVLRHPFQGGKECPEYAKYLEQLRERREKEINQLAELTGWPVASIRKNVQNWKDDSKEPGGPGGRR